MSNRLPLYILGLLVVVALVWRVFNPPAPALPGPLGKMPHWNSATKAGDMGPAAVNPDGTMWAGAWNETDKNGERRSAVVIIDLAKKTAQHVSLGAGYAQSLFWQNADSFNVVMTGSSDLAEVVGSKLVTCNGAGECNKSAVKKDFASILAWTAGSDMFIARLPGSPVRTAVMDSSRRIVGKETTLDVPADAKFSKVAALSPDGTSYVFGVEKAKLGGTQTFYLADAKTGVAKELFTSNDVPGIVEGMWISPAGVLIFASERGKLREVRYDLAAGKMVRVTSKAPIDVAKSWPDAPAKMMFVTYDGGYQVDLRTGKAKRIVEFDTSNRQTTYWRREVQGGRMYPRKGGDYTSVSYSADEVDIRVIQEDGSGVQDILRRR